jgi:hypothetical protein
MKAAKTLVSSLRDQLHSACVGFISGYGQVASAVYAALKTGHSELIAQELDSFAPTKDSDEASRKVYQKLRDAINQAARRYAEDNKESIRVFRKPKGAQSHIFETPTAPRGNSKKAKDGKPEEMEVNPNTFGLAINSIILSLDKSGQDGLRLVADYVASLVEARVKKAA